MTDSGRKIVIIGAGGHGRAVLNLARSLGYEVLGIYDDSFDPALPKEIIMGCPLVGRINDLPKDIPAVFGVGSDEKRRALFLTDEVARLNNNLIHPTALIEDHAKLGVANLIMAKAYLNAMAEIGDNNIINTGAIIEHESKVGSHCHISVGVLITGRVKIGDRCFIGAGTVIRDGISIGDDITVGAGSVVVKNLTEPGVYVGNPAKKLR